jgi:hypothetical protein
MDIDLFKRRARQNIEMAIRPALRPALLIADAGLPNTEQRLKDVLADAGFEVFSVGAAFEDEGLFVTTETKLETEAGEFETLTTKVLIGA